MPCRMCEMRYRSVVLLIVARHLINAGRPTLLWIIVRSIVRCCSCGTTRLTNAGEAATGRSARVTGDGREVERTYSGSVVRRPYPVTYTARAVYVAGVPLAASVVGRQ